jgi:DNA-binding protein HU-beta
MTKTDLIAAIAENTSLTKTQASEALNATLEAIVNSVASGDSVVIPGFGTFEKRHRDARTGRNPQTGETTTIAATDVPAFKAGKGFKDKVKAN